MRSRQHNPAYRKRHNHSRQHQAHPLPQPRDEGSRRRPLDHERAAVPLYDDVNVIPQPKAGGSFATTAYKTFKEPVAVEHIKADAGLDIGGTLIGMHLKEVAVPLRLSLDHIGNAILLAARTRPKFIGGIRATYNEDLL